MSSRFIPIPDTEAEFIRAAHAAKDMDALANIVQALVPDEYERFHLIVIKDKTTNIEKLYLVGHGDNDPSEAWKRG